MSKRNGLGKGLNSLLGEATVETGGHASECVVKIESVKPNPYQPRKNFDEGELEELVDSIKKHGVLQPILVRKMEKEYQVVAGERRYRASQLAGLKEIPIIVRDIDDEEVFELALIENLQRSDLSPIEEAQGYRHLINEKGYTQEQLGAVLSKSRSAIANTLRLLDLPETIQDYMIKGYLTPGHARAILAIATEEGRLQLANKVIEDNLTVRQTEKLAPLFTGIHEPKTPRQIVPQSYKRAARHLRKVLDTKVRIKRVRGKNKIEIEFVDEDDLMRILDRLDTEI